MTHLEDPLVRERHVARRAPRLVRRRVAPRRLRGGRRAVGEEEDTLNMARPQREGRVRDVVARRPKDERDAVVAFRSSQLRVESRQGRYLRESSLCHQHAAAAAFAKPREGNKSYAAKTHRRAEDPGVLRVCARAEPQAPLLDGVCRRRRRDLRGNQNVTASSC